MSVRYTSVSSIEFDRQPGDRLSPEKPDPHERIWVTVLVRSQCTDEERLRAVEELASKVPGRRKFLTLKQFERRFGSSSTDFRKIIAFGRKFGLRVIKPVPASCALRLTGKLAQFSKAFRVEFVNYESAGGPYLSHAGPLQVPADLAPLINGVFGFDARPMNATPHATAAAQPVQFTPPADVAAAYRFPPGAAGKGQVIAIIELDGGFHDADLSAFFEKQGLKKPKIKVVSINGAKCNPASAQDIQDVWKWYTKQPGPPPQRNALWTIESTVDIELAGALANQARIRVYYAPNTLQGKFDAYLSALFKHKHRPAVVSCSWGTPEKTVPRAYAKLLDRVFQCAALLGVTICYSAGDGGDGSVQCGSPCVQFPASSPHVLAVGGTRLVFPGGVCQEAYWNESLGPEPELFQGGHGVSEQFPLPAWQRSAGVKTTGRAVPDVSGKADLEGGYDCVIGNIPFPGGGTSAAAPMWAALIALLSEQLGAPVGYLTPLLYSSRFASATNPVGGASCWDTLTGRGSPEGGALLAALMS